MNSEESALSKFLFPTINLKFVIRVAIVAAITMALFHLLFKPFQISGISMLPTYHDGFVLSWNPAYWFNEPAHGDVVILRMTTREMYIKRIIGLEGDTIAFQDGKLIRNGVVVDEPYVQLDSDWNMEPTVVEPGKVYVVGDNRSMDIDMHEFGQLSKKRIIGKPLW